MRDSSFPLSLGQLLVADFSRVLAGPSCTMARGDLGACRTRAPRLGGHGRDIRQWLTDLDAQRPTA
jgi:crotonobetainyl-CoA:carnitine CoA-transferase CaiB-like acyl-CoA transferase